MRKLPQAAVGILSQEKGADSRADKWNYRYNYRAKELENWGASPTSSMNNEQKTGR
jgi:hypothetical protein